MTSFAFFLPNLVGGGAERVTLTIAAGLAERGHDVELILAERSGALAAEVSARVRVVDLARPRVSTAMLPLRRHLQQSRPDVVVSAPFHANLVALAATRALRIPLVVVEHNTMSVKFAATTGWRDKVAPIACALTYRFADQIGAVSEGVADNMADFLHLSRSRIRVLRNPVDYAEVIRRADDSDDHWPPGFATGEGPVVLAVGRLTAQKDFGLLIRAVAATSELRLLILGEGEDRNALEDLISELRIGDRVSLPGFVANPYPSFRRADVIAMSSRWEGLPTVLLEALPFPARIVSTDCPSGPDEILEGGKFGRLVPVGDVGALAQALQDAAAEDPMDRSAGWARYDLPVAVSDYEKVASDVILHRRRA